MSKTFDDLISKVKEIPMKKVSVAVAQDSAVLEAVRTAKDRKIADAILVGDESKIKAIASDIQVDISDFEIVNVEDDIEASLAAVKLVHEGKADMYMKGLIDTKHFLKSVLDKEVGLRTGKPLSHVCVFDIEGIDKIKLIAGLQNEEFSDFEDCLQMQCAKSYGAGYIVTRNIDDYKVSETKAILPKDYLEILQ